MTMLLRFKDVLLCAALVFVVVAATKNVDTENLTHMLTQNAYEQLNNLATTQRYKSAKLISGYVLTEQPDVVYRLELDLETNCNDETCSHEKCIVDMQQHDGSVRVQSNVCTTMEIPRFTNNLNYAPRQEENSPESVQDNVQNSLPDQRMIEQIEKQIIDPQFQSANSVYQEMPVSEEPFVAEKAKNHYCPGCRFELKPNLPGLWTMGEEVLDYMEQQSTSAFKYKILEISKAFRSTPFHLSAVRYELIMKIANSTCLKESMVDRSECATDTNTSIKLCISTIDEKPWQMETKRTISQINCTDSTDTVNSFDDSVSTNEDDTQSYVKPESYEYDQIAQEDKSIQTVSNNNPETLTLEQSLMQYMTNFENKRRNPTEIEDKYKEFDEFLKDFDVPVSEVNETDDRIPVVEEEFVKVQIPVATETMNLRSKRQLTPDRLFRRKLAQIVIDLLDGLDEDNDKRLVLDVLNTTQEADNASVYHLTVKVIYTKCPEKEAVDRKCTANLVGPTNTCHMEVVLNQSRPLGPPTINNSTCIEDEQIKPLRKKRAHLVGGKRPIDINDPQVQEYAALGLSKYTELYEGPDQPFLMEVIDAKSQVVAGMLYEITVKIGESNCTKGSAEECHPKEDPNAKYCLVSIWSRPWLDKGQPEVKVNCTADSRTKRSLRGQNYSLRMQSSGKRWLDEEQFTAFKKTYGKIYSPEEENIRFKNFQENLEIIKKLQANEQGTARYGITQFADLTVDEFRKMHTGLKQKENHENSIPLSQADIPDISLPEEFDWRHYNVVTPVKDQGSCGSCWAFSVTGNIESLYAIKHNKLLSLSEQELVDCDKLDDGCNGGLPTTAYEAIERLGGLETEDEYPYQGDDEKCHFNKKFAKVQISSGLNITQNETQMAQWLMTNGPITIGINANAMMFYLGGISHPFKFMCNPKNLDHGVLIVGFGVKRYPIFNKVLPYWIIKNSWGPRWGEQGYYRVYRGDGTCGVNQMPTSAVVI